LLIAYFPHVSSGFEFLAKRLKPHLRGCQSQAYYEPTSRRLMPFRFFANLSVGKMVDNELIEYPHCNSGLNGVVALGESRASLRLTFDSSLAHNARSFADL
jgi:hypothetical protein